MKHRLIEFLVGLIFGIGLLLSGMSNPSKVLGFLDILGLWDPSLLLVMGGAVFVGLFAFHVAKTRTKNLLGGPLHIPSSKQIDYPLIIGAIFFGIGWGLAGFCPGPAIISFAQGQEKAMAFVFSMIAGMIVFEIFNRRLQK